MKLLRKMVSLHVAMASVAYYHRSLALLVNQLKKKTFPLYRVVDQPRIEFDIKHIADIPVRNKFLGVLVKFVGYFCE